MTEDTIPLEAGIEDRAISFTKGCYVGQEVIVRVTHRGGGRVAKKLVSLEGRGISPGRATNVLRRSRHRPRHERCLLSRARPRVGLGYVHRDFVEPGTKVTVVWDDARSEAVIQ